MPKIDWPLGKYVLTEKAYMGRTPGAMHELLEADTVVTYQGKPGPHMRPADDAAKSAVAMVRGDIGTLDPASRLDLTVSPDSSFDAKFERLVDAMASRFHLVDHSVAPEPLKNAAREAEIQPPAAAEPAPAAPQPPPAPPAPPAPPSA